MITPPEELIPYISTNTAGEWIHDPNMPVELEEKFQKFVKDESEFRKTRENGLLEA
jgi:hypothetical protein